MALGFYTSALTLATPLLRGLLAWRQSKGKEDPQRLPERMGEPSLPRPEGRLVWIHAASVGEAQSALILIDHIKNSHILVTSGTVTSAQFLSKRLPAQAIHQYMPLDAPQWVARFLDHWQPDFALWMESELWPNMLMALKARGIPAALINARLSDQSYVHWKRAPKTAHDILSCFSVILAQTQDAAQKYENLGARSVHFTDNLKYSANDLPCDQQDLQSLKDAIGPRPVWIYASTHDGEEQLAARLHARLIDDFPALLTIIVPRHPERRGQIAQSIAATQPLFRSEQKTLPDAGTGIYVADTLGELGLFYRAAPIALIGRSFSHDGGGSHNPIEPAQLDCAVLTGPHYQNQQTLFDEMLAEKAALLAPTEDALYQLLKNLLSDPAYLMTQQANARNFAARKSAVIDTVMTYLTPVMKAA